MARTTRDPSGQPAGTSLLRPARPRPLIAGALLALLVSLVPTAVAVAATITPATGGGAISADTAVTGGTGTYTTLSGPSIALSLPSELYAETIVFTAPSGFEFAKNAPFPSVAVGTTGAVIGFTGANTAKVTFTVTSRNTAAGTLTFSGLRVRPVPATPLASGSILMSGAGLGGNAGTLVEVPGAAILSFASQPASLGTGGATLTGQPVVFSRDQFSNRRINDPITLSVASGTGTPGAALACGQPGNVAYTQGTGYAFFDGCAIDKAGTGYRIHASASGSPGVDSNPVQIIVGPPTKLVFNSYPSSPSTTDLGPITVAIADAGGNTVASSATIQVRSYDGALAGCAQGTSQAVTAGTATFTGCTLPMGTSRAIVASSSGGFAGQRMGARFDVTSGPATKLVFSTQPTGGSGGTPLGAQPAVTIQDADGRTVTADSSSVVALALQTPTSGGPGTLACTGGTSKQAVAGVATFAGCSVDRSGTGYALGATSGSLAGATSAAFDVTVGPPARLGFSASPGGATAGVPFGPQPRLTVQDAGGNTVTDALATAVTLALGANPAGGTLTCSGGLSVTTISGVAAFRGCAIDRAGTGYTLAASADGLAGATTVPFEVTGAAASLSIAASPGSIARGASATLTIRFAAAGAGRTVQLEARTARDSGWVALGSMTTDAAGRATFTVKPDYTASYRGVFVGTPDLAGAVSPAATVVVRHSIVLAPRSPAGKRVYPSSTTVTYRATERPVTAGQRVTFLVYQRVRGAWVQRSSVRRVADARGVAAYTRTWTRGEWYIRARAEATALNGASLSNIERVVVQNR